MNQGLEDIPNQMMKALQICKSKMIKISDPTIKNNKWNGTVTSIKKNNIMTDMMMKKMFMMKMKK